MTGDTWIALAASGALVAALVSLYEAYLGRHSREGEVLLRIYDALQSEHQRYARRRFYRELEPRTFTAAAPVFTEEEKDLVDDVAHPFQLVGLLVSHGLIGVDKIDSWAHSINRVWRVAEPIVQRRRLQEGNPSLWSELERLAAICRKRDRGFESWLRSKTP